MKNNENAGEALDLNKLEALAKAAEQMFTGMHWYTRFQILDGISNDESAAFIGALDPDTVLELIALARNRDSVRAKAIEDACHKEVADLRAALAAPTDTLRDMLAIQEACGLHNDEYAPGSVIEYIKELEALAAPAAAVQPSEQEWISVEDQLPAARQIVLVMSESWEFPAVLKYQVQPYQRFIDEVTGRWYWYPERMHWTPLPALPKAAATPEQSDTTKGQA